MRLPTVKIIAKNKSGYIVINESDFDEKKQKLYVEPSEVVETVIEEQVATITIDEPEPESKKKRGRPPLNKKENPFD